MSALSKDLFTIQAVLHRKSHASVICVCFLWQCLRPSWDQGPVLNI